MNTERGRKARGLVWLLPVVTAVPAMAAMTFLALRYGNLIHKLVNILVKMAVTA